MSYIKKIKLPNNPTPYDIYDEGAVRKEELATMELITIEDIDEICGTQLDLGVNISFNNFSVTNDGEGNITLINKEGV